MVDGVAVSVFHFNISGSELIPSEHNLYAFSVILLFFLRLIFEVEWGVSGR